MAALKFSLFLLLAALCAATTSQGGIIAERGLPDGIYQAVAVQGPSFEPPSAVPSGHRSRRRRGLKPGKGDFYEKPGPIMADEYSVPIPASRLSCHKDPLVLNSTEYRRAVDNLWDFCQSFNIPFHGTHFSIVGDVVVYVCAYGKERVCHRHEWLEAEEYMDRKCGQGRGSHLEMQDWLKEYGRAYAGKMICASWNFGADLAWKVQPLPVWANGQMLGQWKAGAPKYKAVDDGQEKKGKTGQH
ncbi:uncharacterized protein TrAFT101_000552 [Trichoderma asperellum]|uniref:Ecp2 effector protein domain-containing protein n=1 Tax=Trichoderma asperellum (strain ATCC 204424 / CBS 433.97 / NBRC 101777) TaxID=1042311 RepID=A0A2T3ZJU9_TRIA4|nr:hypothetical protein M441DRAFT_305699 [Trichoderma asperellum CBS 433.97]PTB45084.1 hypothetical protein M441DRAFT_305699 [Trichoderma asperellum CBS 433.97]UKZ84653.1 hypothetical protein TrAFT101_000552 [Trichoderma asperellum]